MVTRALIAQTCSSTREKALGSFASPGNTTWRMSASLASPRKMVWQMTASLASLTSMIRYVVFCTENIFYMYKTVQPKLAKFTRLAKLNRFANLLNTRQTRLARVPIFLTYSLNLTRASTYFFDILAKIDSREYLFLTYSPNLTRVSTYF